MTSMPETLWHYTDSAGALGILESDTLWATSMSHLNDTGELKYGLQLADGAISRFLDKTGAPRLRRFYEILREQMRAMSGMDCFYVTCASMKSDDLSQWRAYGRNGGYALGIKRSIQHMSRWVPYIPGVDVTADPTESIFRRVQLGTWSQVIYDESDQLKRLYGSLSVDDGGFIREAAPSLLTGEEVGGECNDAYIEGMASLLAQVLQLEVLYFKQEAFSDESECRIVVQDPTTDGAVRFRSGPFGITPYMSITPCGRDLKPTVVGHAARLPISEVMVGPSAHTASAKAGMERLLSSRGHSGVDVHISGATYRAT